MAGRSSRSEFRSGSDDIRGATSDSDLEPRSAASEDPSSETHELDEEQSKDVLSRAIQRNFPDVKNEASTFLWRKFFGLSCSHASILFENEDPAKNYRGSSIRSRSNKEFAAPKELHNIRAPPRPYV